MATISDARLIELPRISSDCGSLTPVEWADGALPFEIARVFYLYDIPESAARAGHAHHRLQELLVCPMGSFSVVLDDGRERKQLELRRPDQGLYVPPMIWRELREFSGGAICVALASTPYEEADYIRDYELFRELAPGSSPPGSLATT